MLKNRISNKVLVFSIVLATIAMISFVEKQQSDAVCMAINIVIDNQLGNHFIDENDVLEIVTNDNDDKIVGEYFSEIDLKQLEKKLEKHPFVYSAEVSRDIRGNLNVNVHQARPIARITHSGYNDKYINHLGQVIPISKKYTSRVMLISGYVTKNISGDNLYDSDYGSRLMELIEFINGDEFWKPMVVQLDIDQKGNISVYTQVSKQLVDFGQPENIEEKFKKLEIFYTRILPSKGWNSYEKVSVKFKNQIVCE